MSIIVDLDYTEAQQYAGRGLSAKYNGKKHRVYIKLRCDDTNIKDGVSFASRDKGVLLVEYQAHQLGVVSGLEIPSNVNVVIRQDFGNNIEEAGVSAFASQAVDGMECVIHLPDDFDDIRFVYDMCMKYSNIRFLGGNLFRLDGCRLGYFDEGLLEKHGVKYKPGSLMTANAEDVIPVVPKDDIEIEVSSKQEKKSNGSTKKKAGTKKAKSKPAPAFSQFLGTKVEL